MNDIDTETRLREQLPRLADFAVGASEATPPLARVQLLASARRPRWRIVAAAGVAAALVVGGVVIVGAVQSGDDRNAPIGVSSESPPPVSTLTITASNFHFDQTEYHVQPGVTDIHFVSDEGSHTLAFADPDLSTVQLAAASGDTGPNSADRRVDLDAGRTYVIYCELPGHRQAGMESRIVVDLPAPTSTSAP